MTTTEKLPGTIAIRSARTIADVAEEKATGPDKTFTQAAEALIADGKRYRATKVGRPRRRQTASR